MTEQEKVLTDFRRKGWLDKQTRKRTLSNGITGFSLDAKVRVSSKNRGGLDSWIHK